MSRGHSPAASATTAASGDSIIDERAEEVPQADEVPQHARPSAEARDPVYNMDGRCVGTPYSARGDVGSIGILAGNWGGHRANRKVQAAMDWDLKRGPATIVCLQEAHKGCAELLSAAVDPPAVAGKGEEVRAPAQYLTLRANETCTTNFIAVRANLATDLASIRFLRTMDGLYKDRGGGAWRREAGSRLRE